MDTEQKPGDVEVAGLSNHDQQYADNLPPAPESQPVSSAEPPAPEVGDADQDVANEPTSMVAAALEWARNSIPVFPCNPQKEPLTAHGFKEATTDETTIKDWWRKWPYALIGMPTGATTGISVLDLDVKNGKDGLAAVPEWSTLSSVIAETRSGGKHVYLRDDSTVTSTSDKLAKGVDTRGKGGYVIVPPSPGYSFTKGGIASLSNLPAWPATYRLPDWDQEAPQGGKGKPKASKRADLKLVAKTLAAIPNPDLGWDDWSRIGMATWSATEGSEDGFQLFDSWSQKSAKHSSAQTRQRWDGITKSPPTSIGMGSLIYEANKEGDADDGPTMRELARGLLDARGARLLRFNGEWLSHCGGAYLAREDEGIRAEVYAHYQTFGQTGVSNVVDALKGLVHLDKHTAQPPCWLDGRTLPDPTGLLVLRNGVLDLGAGQLQPHTDALFTRNALEFDYDPNAPTPTRWLQFLQEVWPNEVDCRDALQQMFGYLLTPDTSQQKIFVLVGPTRCGKGTIGRVLGKLLGRHNVCSPSLRSMGENFGMQCMIGKQATILADMRMGPKTDQAAVAENLLKISGEDGISIPRKNMIDWEGKLGVRFVILTNDAPTLNDASGALMARYIVLQMRQSFLGREDRTLDDQLAMELPSILNWAIAGWRKLQSRGKLLQPGTAADIMQVMDRMAAPVRAFVDDECVLDPAGQVDKDELYDLWKHWCDRSDRKWFGTKDSFGKELLETCPEVKPTKAREGGKRKPVYRGIRLRDQEPEMDPDPPPF